eukprot:365480-Chlamydomonas_euryale.AAC.15
MVRMLHLEVGQLHAQRMLIFNKLRREHARVKHAAWKVKDELQRQPQHLVNASASLPTPGRGLRRPALPEELRGQPHRLLRHLFIMHLSPYRPFKPTARPQVAAVDMLDSRDARLTSSLFASLWLKHATPPLFPDPPTHTPLPHPQVAAVKAPGFGENRKANLADIATLTGGEVVSEELGYKMETVEVGMLGSAKRVTLTKDDTIVLHGAGGRDSIKERCEMIRQAMDTTTSDYDRCVWGFAGVG